MEVAFIAGKYRAKTIHEIVRNIRAAEKIALKYWGLGYTVICPHKNSGLLDGALPDEVWLAGGLELLRRSDTIIMSPKWEESPGSMEELKLAANLDKRIIYEKENK